jgi:pimeloyl-ACP methyl ester carboxylesterase
MPSRDLGAATRLAIDGTGVVLSVLDCGGRRPPAVLLHSLAGHAEEWADTASWLRGHRRVVALDLRGHGHSTRFPRTFASAAFTALLVPDLIRDCGRFAAILKREDVGRMTVLQITP